MVCWVVGSFIDSTCEVFYVGKGSMYGSYRYLFLGKGLIFGKLLGFFGFGGLFLWGVVSWSSVYVIRFIILI